MAGLKILQNRGFIVKEDSQFYIFEREDLGHELFDQIKIRKDNKTFKCATYILTKEDGYKVEAMTLDTDIIAGILVFLSDIRKKEKTNGEN